MTNISPNYASMGNPKKTFPVPAIFANGNMTRMEMEAKFIAYAIAARGWFGYLCIALLS